MKGVAYITNKSKGFPSSLSWFEGILEGQRKASTYILPSPEVSPVQLSSCIQDILKFLLQSSINGDHLGLGLAPEFCSSLLTDEPQPHDDDPAQSSTSQFPPHSGLAEGVPSYPLYKHLASALEHWIVSGSYFSPCENALPLCEDESLKPIKDEENELVSQKGSELVTMLKSIKFRLHVQEPYFTQLKDGLKTVKGRCATGDYTRMQSGDLVLFNNCSMLEIQDVHHYASFVDMLEAETLEKVLPGVQTIAEGEQVYRRFYTKEKEQLNGVLAICVGRPASQPYTVLSDIFSGLGYRGIQSLLGLRQTVGTIPEALPPPRSTLLSSFTVPHKPEVKGCSLTDGARALAKHVNRCSSNYWGKLEGDDSTKNRLALEVRSRIMLHCCWMNVHIVQPHDAVFEIRVAEGYGARWSKDGTKFIGFLEPYMEDGHSKKWRH